MVTVGTLVLATGVVIYIGGAATAYTLVAKRFRWI